MAEADRHGNERTASSAWRDRWLWPSVAAVVAALGGFAPVAADFASPPERMQVTLALVTSVSAAGLAFATLRAGHSLRQRQLGRAARAQRPA
ncbi:MAG TPA: hypothetical protein VNV66_03835, partial [Pilimelia sp.]|nr:hypothetical protein [Pilimelia sp.]